MSETTITDVEKPRPEWTKPVLEDAGTIHDVEGGAKPGLDSNGLPARLS